MAAANDWHGKVRIFELAKEVGLTSKELIALFNERLGGVFEAKNQLSVVPDKSPIWFAACSSRRPQPRPRRLPRRCAGRARSQSRCSESCRRRAGAARCRSRLFRVYARSPRARRAARCPRRAAAEPGAPPRTVEAPDAAVAAAPAPAAAAPEPQRRLPSPRRVRRARSRPTVPIPRLQPVPHGQALDRPPPAAADHLGLRLARPARPACPAAPASRRVPARRCPGQGGKGPVAPARAAATARSTPPGQRRPAGNGPFRPLAPGRAPGRAASRRAGDADRCARAVERRPSRRSRPRSHEDKAAAKKDREKELLLEKERQRKKKGGVDAAPPTPARALETIEIPDLLTVQELATSMIVPVKDVITELIKIGTMATINQNISSDVAIAGCQEVRLQRGRQRGRRRSHRRARRRQARDDDGASAGRHRARSRRPRQDVAAR